MTKVITYGTYDYLHYGHINLLQRAKQLGDYLVVGVTANDFDKSRGKINVQQSLIERIEAIKATGLADEIIVEEYEGQKIDDIKRKEIDIFTVGSDWKGEFDYLKEYCEVIYLERTQGISSSDIRSAKKEIKIGLIGDPKYLIKFVNESKVVNGIEIAGAYLERINDGYNLNKDITLFNSYDQLIDCVDAVYVISHPTKHYEHVKKALEHGKHVLCEAPIALEKEQCCKLFDIADKRQCILMAAIKTAYMTAYERLLLLAKSGIIGEVVAIDVTCTSLQEKTSNYPNYKSVWNSICSWGPTAMLPVFQLLGDKYAERKIITHMRNDDSQYDLFTKIDFLYEKAVASIKVAKGVKSEGELIISGTEGYIYVPAPWWKTDYFEVRYENSQDNKRMFYQCEGEGIRYEIVAFKRAIEMQKNYDYVSRDTILSMGKIYEDFYKGINVTYI